MITIDARWVFASGIGTYCQNLIPGLLSNFNQYPFTLLGHIPDLKRLGLLDYQNVSAIQTTAKMYSISEQLTIPFLVPRQTNLLFCPHYNIPLLYRGKTLVTVHDLCHLAMPDLFGGIQKRLYARLFFAAVKAKAKIVITDSEFTKAEFKRLIGSCAQPVRPILLGVDSKWFSIPPQTSPHPNNFILYVGNVKPHKNLNRLIQAFSQIAPRVSHDLVIVGRCDGFITGDDDLISKTRSITNRVIFTGNVGDEKLRQYFAHADMLVFPSLYEGFGLPPLEAMAAGCPTLVSSVGPMPEVCLDASLYCDPTDVNDIALKMEHLLSNPPLRVMLRSKGLARAKELSWNSCINKTCEVIRDLVDEQTKC